MLHAIMLLDESGSMEPVKEDVIGGYKQYVKTLQEGEGDVCLSLFTFDKGGWSATEEEILHPKFVGKQLKELPKLASGWYTPRGGTPLNDAVLACIKHMKKDIPKGDDVVMIIYTDGLENASRASNEEVKGKIAKMEKKGWDFVYLGANQDAWDSGMGIGVSGLKLNTSGTNVGTQAMYVSAGTITNTARRASSQGVMSVGEGGTLDTTYKGKDIGEKPIEEDEDGTS